MLANDVLPFFCGVLGRIVLELREHADPGKRTAQPFVLVLEEAHNYLKPPREHEPAGTRLSRETFERVAKEGRKFGLSLVVASQRPSDVSATVLSQCANYVVHRIQNPDDIEFFKRILPLGSRDLLDQIPILAPGDALLMGSAVNVPVRVRIRPPSPPPTSETPKPWQDWQPGKPPFNVNDSISVWLSETGAPTACEEKQTLGREEPVKETPPLSGPEVDKPNDIPF
jgi:DNA helicase HerA-like ATPase